MIDLARLSHGLPRPLLLAVSGGPDSMALLVLAAAALPGEVAAATVDHGLRTDAADEARMVAAACARLGVPHAVLAGTVAPSASLQAHARALRYRLLADHARSIGAGAIVTAHHADDQAETLLMRAARGVGLSGLAGIRARVTLAGAIVIRPLLSHRRADLRTVAERSGLGFVDDPSNADPRHDRTRFRALLAANPWIDPARLARSAAALAEADADLRAVADWLWAERATVDADGVTLAVAAAGAGVPRGLLRLLARRAIGAVRDPAAEGDGSEAANVEALLDALLSGGGATRAGVVADVRGGAWRFRVAPPRRAAPR